MSKPQIRASESNKPPMVSLWHSCRHRWPFRVCPNQSREIWHFWRMCVCGICIRTQSELGGVHAVTFTLANTASTAGVNKCGAGAARLSSEADCGGRVSDVLKLETSINGGADRASRAAACGAQTWCWHLGVGRIVDRISFQFWSFRPVDAIFWFLFWWKLKDIKRLLLCEQSGLQFMFYKSFWMFGKIYSWFSKVGSCQFVPKCQLFVWF